MKIILTVLLLAPMITLAAPTTFSGLAGMILDIIASLVVLLFGLTFIVFAWGIIKAWILNPGDEQKIASGKQIALAGIIGLVVMSGVWGFVKILQEIFTS